MENAGEGVELGVLLDSHTQMFSERNTQSRK